MYHMHMIGLDAPLEYIICHKLGLRRKQSRTKIDLMLCLHMGVVPAALRVMIELYIVNYGELEKTWVNYHT